MALSYIDYTADGIQTNFVSKPYLKEEHVSVYINGAIQSTSNYSISGTVVSLNTAPVAGAAVRIGRNSSQTERINDYSDASLLTADTMDQDANQLFFMSQEALDTASETNLATNKFYTAQTAVPTAPNLGDLWYDINTTTLKVWNGSMWALAAPLSSTSSYETFDNTESGYSFIAVPDVNENAMVFLNGVKQIKSATKANVLATATDPDDYFVDTAQNRIYFATLSAGSTVEVVVSITSGFVSSSSSGSGSSSSDRFSLVEDTDPSSSTFGKFIFTDSLNNVSFILNDDNSATVPIPTYTSNGDGTFTITNGYSENDPLFDSITLSNGEDGTTPVFGTDYFNGNDGSFKSFVYAISTSQPPTPSGGTFNGSVETMPTSSGVVWTDNPTATASDVEWISTATYTHDRVTDTWTRTVSDWSVPSMHFQKGADGADGSSVNIKGTLTSTDDLDGLPVALGDGYLIGGDLYVCTSTTAPIDVNDFTNVGQITGTDGVSAYIHFAYASNADGTSNFSTSDPTGRAYLGVYSDGAVADSTNPAHYQWVLVKGNDGTTITWKGTFANQAAFDAAHTAADGDAYYNTGLTPPQSLIYQDNAWYQVSVDGADGAAGTDGMVWKGHSVTAPENPQLNWAYKDISPTDGRVYIYNGYTWEVMSENGTDGENGANGTDGTDGVNVYIAYHNNPVNSEPAEKPHRAFLAFEGNSAYSSTYPANGWSSSASADSNWLIQGLGTQNVSVEWGNPIRITGQDGEEGTNGTNGSGIFSGNMAGDEFTPEQADVVILERAQRTPVVGDVVTLSQINLRTNAVTKICTSLAADGSGAGVYGETVAMYIDGSLVVDGSITTNKITVGTLNADRLEANTLTVDYISSNNSGGFDISAATQAGPDNDANIYGGVIKGASIIAGSSASTDVVLKNSDDSFLVKNNGEITGASLNGFRLKTGSFKTGVDDTMYIYFGGSPSANTANSKFGTEGRYFDRAFSSESDEGAGVLDDAVTISDPFTKLFAVIVTHIGPSTAIRDVNWTKVDQRDQPNRFMFNRDNNFDGYEYFSYIAIGI